MIGLKKSTLSERVSELLNGRALRLEKIENASRLTEEKIKELNSKMSDLLSTSIELELEGNVEKQKEIERSISSLRAEIMELEDKKGAYKRVSSEDKSFYDAIPKVIEAARKENDERVKLYNKKISEREALELKTKEIEREIEKITDELDELSIRKQANKLIPLIKYIEPRKIKPVSEERYLQALIEDAPLDIIEQYLETSNSFEKRPENLLLYSIKKPSDQQVLDAIRENNKRLAKW